MKRTDFDSLEYFSYNEIKLTGALINGLQFVLMDRVDKLRDAIKRRIHPLKNGFNSGEHKSIYHKTGYAIDFTLDPKDGPVDVNYMICMMEQIGFKGIGVYWNGKQWSFHGDLRQKVGKWKALKVGGGWLYTPLVDSDPSKLY